MKVLGTALFAFLTLSPAWAQGSDNCATPTVLTGTGVFPVDSTSATNSGGNPGCITISADVWFLWTAPTTGNALLHLCGQVTFDCAIAVYATSTCPGLVTPSIACDDDSCGLESLVSFPVSAGGAYMFQIGHSGMSVSGGAGTLTIDVIGPPVNDNCAQAIDIGSSGGAFYDNSLATAGSEGQGNPCPSIQGDVWFLWTATQNGTATMDTCFQSSMDTNIAVYAGAGCPAGASIACNDNDPGCGPGSSVTWNITTGSQYMLQIGNAPSASGGSASFVITEQGNGTTGTPYCAGDGSGTPCPCANSGASGHGCANSVVAAGALLAASGSASVTNDSLLLQGTSMPATVSALYFQGTVRTNGGAGNVFGDGLRCASGTIARLGLRMNAAGASGYGSPLGDIPVSVRGAVPAAGGLRVYQVWYRNPATFCTSSTFNLSNGVEVIWAP